MRQITQLKVALLLCLFFFGKLTKGQDTFSILAFDSITREIGAAGASCVDLYQTGFQADDFICEIFPDTGAIATQAAYQAGNQVNARKRMRAGDSPAQIMSWLNTNDLGLQPQARQYGAIRFGHASAAFSGNQCIDHKGHRVGPNYTIHGNILLGPEVLDSMEARFLRTKGDLACKLMGAMQGANMVGADTRCASNNSSSLFAFLKVSIPSNPFGAHHLIVSLRTHNGDSIEPIDSLQKLFTFQHSCPATDVGLYELTTLPFSVSPDPQSGELTIKLGNPEPVRLRILSPDAREVYSATFNGIHKFTRRGWPPGLYIFEVTQGRKKGVKKAVLQ